MKAQTGLYKVFLFHWLFVQMQPELVVFMTHFLLVIIYLAFISLGLPDSLLGSAWPSMQETLAVPLSYAGYVSMVISLGTIVSSLMSDRMTRLFGTGRVTAVSVAMTAVGLFGFSVSSSYYMLLLWAIPYGLGAGSIDAALNNYVALHYASRHMSLLHCMWGVGTIVGPYVMGFALTHGMPWNSGYRAISMIQIVLAVFLVVSLPVWKKNEKCGESDSNSDDAPAGKAKSVFDVVKLPGVKVVLVTFFCYCALEIVAIVWSGSYLAFHGGYSAEKAAYLSSMFFIGITVGRAVCGFMTYRFSDTAMIRIGEGVIFSGIVLLLLPLRGAFTLAGLVCIGVGCAPIYPSIIHSTPEYFGRDNSQALIGLQMASAYTGTCLMPSAFGIIAEKISPAAFPVIIGVILVIMAILHEVLVKKVSSKSAEA